MKYLNGFLGVRRKILRDSRFDPKAWHCLAGLWPDANMPKAVVFKLRQHHWSTDPPEAVVSTVDIFFSVWIEIGVQDAKLLKLQYNLHALKLRQLKPYRLESRKFAADFRKEFLSHQHLWPDARIDFGPQTLFQGSFVCRESQIGAAAFDLAEAFLPLADVVNRLLENCLPAAGRTSKRI